MIRIHIVMIFGFGLMYDVLLGDTDFVFKLLWKNNILELHKVR